MNTIFTLYINVPKKYLEASDNTHIADKFADNFKWLVSKQREYADKIGCDYYCIQEDNYYNYRDWFLNNHPYVNEYCIVNFYKIHLMYKLSKKYSNVLYLDLDVIPWTKENIFEAFDFNDGIICRVNHEGKFSLNTNISYNPTIRAPKAKWWNARALLLDEGFTGENDVYNTGIVGGSRAQIKKLNYFEEFDKEIL